MRLQKSIGAAPLAEHFVHGVMPQRQTEATAQAGEVAEYIAEMTAELVKMAAGSNLELLAYFLDMARIESELTVARCGPPKMTTLPYGR